jgi:FG-GAP repeat
MDAIGDAEQGLAVSLSGDGNTAIVGGPVDNGNIGAAWVFIRSRGVWTQQTKLIGTGVIGPYAAQGSSVSLSSDGNIAIVGGPDDNYPASGSTNVDPGAAWVFTRSGTVWTQQAKLIGTGAIGNADQGASVGLSSNGTAIVGGYFDNSNTGAAWVYVFFAGAPGNPNCHGQSVTALQAQYGGLAQAASALGYSSVSTLQNAIRAYCAT